MNDSELLVWVTIVCTMDLVVVTLNGTPWYSIIVASLDYLYVGRRYFAENSWHSQMFNFNMHLHHLMLDV